MAGLGNPGPEYADTRHNMGFLVADELAGRLEIPLSRQRFDSIFGQGFLAGKKITIAKPTTYMNLSGRAVAGIMQYFGIEANGLIVVHDDLDLVFGQIKIKEKGGDGGHKGVKSIIGSIGGGDFVRLRIGIGRPEQKAVTNFVLGRFDLQERQILDKVIPAAGSALETIILQGPTAGMNQFNNKPI
ncbi:MAG: aminoacyl-tRNA hydrolase [Desulfatibacillaceae bacterium]|nr:aminoacyl-tRNA hydrolase [Desulfatibacillaceae bacterium]